MPDKPTAEVAIDDALVRRLLASQASDIIHRVEALPVAKAAEGWDCEVWRIGSQLAVRLPRRALAAPLVRNEQRVLPGIAARVEAAGVQVPAPIFCGEAGSGYPWRWSIVPWIVGVPGSDIPRPERFGWAAPLAAALHALHQPAAGDFPTNPFRGVPLAARSDAVGARLDHLRSSRMVTDDEADVAADVWTRGLSAAPWNGPPLWIHGDLHPANLVALGSRLVGIIDFGDVTAGDPAYDLAIAWLAFDDVGRRAFISATGRDEATWTRARAWATAVALMLLAHSDDEPAYADLGRRALDEIAADSGA